MRNATGKAIEFSIDGLPARPPTVHKVPPGGTVEIGDGYCRGSGKLPSVISRIAPGLVPDDGTAQVVPVAVSEAPPSLPVLESLRKRKGKEG